MKTYITKLTLQGFKSFNKRVSIPLLPGFNAIAGPNGVGKSNLTDAISFVLGKTSAKALRANRLLELVFYGTEKKAPAKYASVTIYFDNSSHAFPTEEKEVYITRKVNRKGVSVYKLNGKTTTREKILEFLSTVRVRPDGYNIIYQGDVTRVLETNAVERRKIIDEISGIAEYNDKKAKAMRDLAVVDEKLKEAEIIITQKYDIFKKLEEERNTAIKFQNLQNQLKVLNASYFNKKATLTKERIENIEDKILDKKEKSDRINKRLEEIDKKLEETEKNVRGIVNKLIDLSKKVEIEKEITNTRSKLLIVKDKIEVTSREIKQLEGLIEKLEALEIKREGFPRAVKEILNLKIKGVYGTVADLISVPEKYRVAIEVAAGPHLNDLIVSDDEVASYCIQYLKREKIGRATFLPLNKIKPRSFTRTELLNREGVEGVASSLIKFDSKFLPAMEFVFGNTLIVRDLESARGIGIGKCRMVTLEGDLIERSGAMVGGYYIKTHPKALEKGREEEIEKYRKSRLSLLKELERMKEEEKFLEEKLKELSKSEETKQLIDLEKIRITSEREIEKLRDEKRKLQEKKINLEIEINRLQIEKAKLETELESVMNRLKDYEGVETIDENLTSLENFIRKTERELKSIGAVNFKAIEEFEKFKTEFDGYKEKYEKILEEKKAVLKMIEEIEEKRREIFYKTLEKVSNEFNVVYNKITGGTASLVLEDPNNLESGLIIQANPPGKKLLNIDAMSGGEKALTALAFLFALQRYRPSPFYVLDEVDAALDKENSQKISKWIKYMSKKSQFIVITHNDMTLKYADRIYGVTMDEGESKILALELPKV